MNKPEALQLVAMMLAVYPYAVGKLDDAAVENMANAYATCLEDADVESATAAVMRLIRTSKWLPTVADVRSAVLDVSVGPARTPSDAWGDVTRAIGRYGSYRRPGHDFEFVDPIVAQVVESFGWRELCLSEFQTADRARFLEAYAQLSTQRRQHSSAGALPAGPSGTRAIAPAETPPKELTKGDDEPVSAAEIRDELRRILTKADR